MKNNLIKISLDKETLMAIGSAILMIALSFAMNLFPNNKIVAIILRNVLMIFLLGFYFPLYFLWIKQGKSLSVLGFHKKKLGVSLILNAVMAVLLLIMFTQKQQSSISLDISRFYAIFYIFVAGIFEMVFIYGFLRYEFERAFGIIPAIILTAIFYSFHHAGFQPEFIELFFVGIMYVSVFYITRNMFIIFPLFWGVGAVWDVLVDSTAGNQINNLTSFLIAILSMGAMIITSVWLSRKKHTKENSSPYL